MPIYFIDNCCNRLFINELIVNPILIESIKIVLNSIAITETGIILKHILRNNIKENGFNFYRELYKMKKIYKSTNYDIHCFKKNFYHAIEKHYCQNSNIRKIKFKFNKSNIIKKVLYKILDDVIYKLKNTNELVFKEFISIII